ncbi:Cys-Gln thioester bond-forming surface protein [Listeria seeligeri]|nr:Cys-Gln thioester bond-forming surface protein [Listeria seeligeri]
MRLLKFKMQRFQVISIVVTIMILTNLLVPFNANAASLKLDETGYNYTGVSFTNGKRMENKIIWNMKMDGKDVFCIDSGAPANTETGYVPEKYFSDKKEMLSKIAYYGFTQTNQSYEDFATTQLLIWEVLGEDLKWTSLPNYWADKEMILDKVRKHDIQPSWDDQSVTLIEGEELVLDDANKIADRLNITSNTTGIQVTKDGTKLKLKADKTANFGEINFAKIPDNKVGTSIVYHKKDRQSLVDFHLQDSGTAKLNVNVIKLGSVDLSKVGQEFGANMPNDNYSLQGATYGIYDSTDARVGELITNEFGKATSAPLILGNYYLLEEKAPLGYLLSKEKIPFKIDYVGQDVEVLRTQIRAADIEQKGTAKLVKEDAETGVTAQGNATLDGAIYELYRASSDELVDTVTIKNGQAEVENLILDDYYWIEKQAPEGYQLDKQRYDFNLKYDAEIITVSETVTIKEKVIKERIKVIKCDDITKEPIKNNAATFKIKDMQTGEFIKQNGKSEFSTDKTGEFTTVDLPYGKYELVEIMAPTNYQLMNKAIPVTIDGSHEGVVEVRVMNTKNNSLQTKSIKPTVVESKRLPTSGDTESIAIILLGLAMATTGLSIYYSMKRKE